MATLAPQRQVDYFSIPKKQQEVPWLPEALYAGYAASPQALPTSLSIPDCLDGVYDSASPSTSPSLSQDDTISVSSLVWDQTDSDPSLSYNSSTSAAISPVSPQSLPFSNTNTYTLDQKNSTVDRKVSQALNNFGSFDDWMPWDDAAQLALSPSIDPRSTELKLEAASPDLSSIRLHSPALNTTSMSNNIDDQAATFQDTMTEEPLFPTPDPLPREGLYSTPLSWERPRVGYNDVKPVSNGFTPLSSDEEARLRDIAMPQLAHRHTSSSSSPSMSPEPQGRKRKSSMSESGPRSGDAQRARGPPVKKTAHNMIEKRYRTNLNDKIAALRDSVPSLRNAARGNDEVDDEEDLDGLAPAHKLNKATILSKATEYIAHLEKRNKSLLKENANLKARVEAFEILMSRGSAAQTNGRPQQPQAQRQQNYGRM